MEATNFSGTIIGIDTDEMASPAGIEPATYRLGGGRSIP